MIVAIDISAVRDGSEKAFVDLYHQLNGRVYNYFLKKERDPEVARDLTQQCFIRIYHYRASLSLSHPLEKQVYIIAKSIHLNHLRAVSRQKSRELVYARAQYPNGEASVQHEHTSFELRDYWEKITSPLPPIRKKVILLKARKGMSNQEIAAELSISVKTVENHITRAHQDLRALSSELLLLTLFLTHL